MKILVDENIPYAQQLFQHLGDVQAVPGRPLDGAVLQDADALMVRSITKVNEALLSGKQVRFVGTATAGTDHVDKAWLDQAGIGFSAAPGCNAVSVVEYVISALLLLAERDGFALKDKVVGIVGVGNVGSRLHQRLQVLGVKTLLCDPPQADKGDQKTFYPLDTLLQQADILTFHTPLNKEGPYCTYHLLDADKLATLPEGRIIINAARGPIIDNAALMTTLAQGKKFSVVLDVWELEPDISLPLLARVDIATPHIAGYSLEGKARGTTHIFEAYTAFLGQPQQIALSDLLPVPVINTVRIRGKLTQAILKRLVHLVYDVRRDDAPLRRVAGIAGEFDRLRKTYPERREWSSLCVICDDSATAEQLMALGFSAQIA